MARRRMRAAARKASNADAQQIGRGVYSIARDLEGQALQLPVYLTAPLIYAAEMVAAAVCREKKWTEREQVDRVAEYVMAGLQETAVVLVESFDEEHFASWSAALEGRVSGG